MHVLHFVNKFQTFVCFRPVENFHLHVYGDVISCAGEVTLI